MSDRGDIEQTILEGGPYDRATTLESRLVPLSLEGKILVCVLALASSSALTPLLYYRRDHIEQLEGTRTLGETLSPALSTLSLIGIVLTGAFGLLLVLLLASLQSRTLSDEEARRFVRIEDLVMVLATIGILSVVGSLLFATVGVVSTETTDRLYGAGVTVYGSGGPVSVDSRVVSGLGLFFATFIYVLFRRFRPVDGRQSS